MANETTRFILGDAAVDALGEPPKRRFFKRREKHAERPLTHCENCGTQLTGEYCAHCGQHAIDYRRSLLRVLVDAADSFLNWDTKFLASIGVLLTRPWRLTNSFNAGQRVRYIHPLRLYLLASIAFFLVVKVIKVDSANSLKFDAADREQIAAALEKLAAPESDLTPEEHAKVDAARAKLGQGTEALTSGEQEQMQSALGTLIAASVKQKWREKDHVKLQKALDRLPTPTPVPVPANPEEPAAPAAGLIPPPPPAPSATPGSEPKLYFSDDPNHQNSPFENWLQTRIKDKVGEDGTRVKLFLGTLRSNIPTMMLCCIPLFAFLLKILYFRKCRYYVEHLVYALHVHSFVYVGVVVITLLGMGAAHTVPALRGWIIGVLTVVLCVQVFLSIRRVYGQGWFFSIVKFLLGGVAYLVILALGIGATAFVTLLMP